MILLLLFVFLLIYGLFLLCAWYRLTEVERKTFFGVHPLVKSGSQCTKFTLQIKYAIQLLCIPVQMLYDKHSYIKFTEGALLNIYNVPWETIQQIEDKIWTHYFFMQHNIPTPPLLFYMDSKLKYGNGIKYFRYGKDYILKPRYGCLGHNIRKINFKKGLPRKIPKHYLVQEFLNDCTNQGKPTSYRIITFYTGKLYKIYCLQQNNTNKITSNHATQGVEFMVELNNLDKSLQNLIQRLCIHHKENWSHVFSLGWDVMIHCTNESVIQHFVLEFNIGHSAIFQKTPSKDIEEYINEATIFHCKN